MPIPRVALISGSTRSGSIHRLLARSLVEPFAAAGIDAELVDLARYPMPIYDGDLEERDGAPATARELAGRLAGFDGLVFVTPEHNGGPSALLKNTIDWITRVDRSVFAPMLIGLAAASPGSRGGATGLRTMTGLIEHMRLELASTQLSVPLAEEAFAQYDDGAAALARPDDIARAEAFVAAYAESLVDRSAVASV